MPTFNVRQLYLGRYSDLDPTESSHNSVDNDNENINATGGPGGIGWQPGRVIDTSNAEILEITQNDDPSHGENRLEEDDLENFTASYDTGNVSQKIPADTYTYIDPVTGEETTQGIDSAFTWNVTVNWIGREPTTHRMGFVQLKNGDIFTNTGVFNGEYDFTSITLDSFHRSDVYGITPGRTVDEGSAFVCFAAGTGIKTADGVCPIEDLSVGQLVLTVDGGLQPVRWIGSRKFDSIDLRLKPNLRPVRIRAGALGEGYPSRDLVVSPQHRVLVRNNLLQRMFCTTEALVAAKHLLELPGIEVAEDLAEVEYFHMMFDRHQIVWSNGAATESMYTGKVALNSLAPEQLAEIFAIFPELRDLPEDWSQGNDTRFIPARLLIPGPKGRHLAYRLRKRHGKFAFAYSTG